MTALGLVGGSRDPLLFTMPKKWSIGFHRGGPSLATLNSLASRIANTQPWESMLGKTLVSYYVDPVSQSVVIGVTAISVSMRRAAAQAFNGLARLTVDHAGMLLSGPNGCRIHDVQAFSGSDRIIKGGTSCSTGYKAYIYVNG